MPVATPFIYFGDFPGAQNSLSLGAYSGNSGNISAIATELSMSEMLDRYYNDYSYTFSIQLEMDVERPSPHADAHLSLDKTGVVTGVHQGQEPIDRTVSSSFYEDLGLTNVLGWTTDEYDFESLQAAFNQVRAFLRWGISSSATNPGRAVSFTGSAQGIRYIPRFSINGTSNAHAVLMVAPDKLAALLADGSQLYAYQLIHTGSISVFGESFPMHLVSQLDDRLTDGVDAFTVSSFSYTITRQTYTYPA